MELVETGPQLQEIVHRYVEVLDEQLTWSGLAVSGLLLGALAVRGRSLGRWQGRVVSLGSLALGLKIVWDRRSLFDDAFISFRYADNLARGHGLVWNLGERVEGFTSPLWTVLLGAIQWMTSIEPPVSSLVLTVACYVVLVSSVFAAGRRLHGPTFVSLAAPLTALNLMIASYATTGMETAMAAMFVAVGVFGLVRGDDLRSRWIAGLALSLATLTRPDQLIFYVAAGAGVLVSVVRDRGRSWRGLIAFGLPVVLVCLASAARWAYYGDLLPNTWYAKRLPEPDPGQALLYGWVFFVGSNLWIVLPLALGWVVLVWRGLGRGGLELKVMLVLGFLALHVYLIEIGGDFMYGRFYLSVLPLLYLGAESAVVVAWRRRSGAGLLLGCALAASVHGVHMLRSFERRWQVTDETTYYRLVSVFPPTVAHGNSDVGRLLGELAERGVRPVVATSGVGQVGYYSRLPVIDLLGLTDARTAREGHYRPDSPPGHRRFATRAHLRSRNAQLARASCAPQGYESITRVVFPTLNERRHGAWCLLRYDPDLARQLEDHAADLVEFVNFERYLDRSRETLAGLRAGRIERDLRFFDEYYFRYHDDPARRDPIARAIEERTRRGPGRDASSRAEGSPRLLARRAIEGTD